MATTLCTGSPVDSMGEFYPLYQRTEAARSLPPIKFIDIQEFYNLIGELPPESTEVVARQEVRENKRGGPQSPTVPKEQGKSRHGQTQPVPKGRTESSVKERVVESDHAFGTLKAFTDVLESCLQTLESNVLRTDRRGSVASAGHPNGPLARPDVVIFREEYSLPDTTDKVFWGSIEMPIEFRSSRKSLDDHLCQAAIYVSYLLEARPDLVSALGLLVELDSLFFLFCNADGINVLGLSNETDYLHLLSTVMKYLNSGQRKNLDPTLSRVKGETFFDVLVPDESVTLTVSEGQQILYKHCTLRYFRDPFGRRPAVFIYKPGTDIAATRVIKDQYIRRGRRWLEKDILAKIHTGGTYPAVVRMCFYGKIPQGECGNHIRVRIALEDYGSDFLSLKTPRDAIYTLYDLLEVTRSLYHDRRILHRDISPGNIMIRYPGDPRSIKTCETASPVFIRHLLAPELPKHKSSIFLIDFGYSQDLDSHKPSRDGRTGTPRFIARAVQNGQPLPAFNHMYFPALPQLSEDIKVAYELAHPKRLELFNGPFEPQIGPSKNPRSSLFKHELYHDGESGIWAFFWWFLLAFPKSEEQNCIDAGIWGNLTPRCHGARTGLPMGDQRGRIFAGLKDGDMGVFHPGYKSIHKLFEDISAAILPDYHWAGDPIRQTPDFVHEILQRIILNFVVENKDAPFMDKEKAGQNRKPYHASSTLFVNFGD